MREMITVTSPLSTEQQLGDKKEEAGGIRTKTATDVQFLCEHDVF